MNEYQPELGQVIFGQSYQEYEVPEIMEAAMRMISDEYSRVYINVKQDDCPSPFSNYGTKLKTPTFKVHAYSWGDAKQAFNFAWRGLRISWYKWCGRGMSANMEVTPDLTAECLAECLAEIRKMEDGETEDGGYPNFIDLE